MPADQASSAGSEVRRFGLFLAAGGLAAGANFGSRFGFSAWFSYPVAIMLAYLVGMAVAFLLMRHYVFDGSGKALGPQVAKFILVNVLAVLQTLVVSLVLARWLLPTLGVESHVEAIAHAFGVAVPAVTSYLGHKKATFR
ncbi:MAG: GtrA family protein [bacterium]